jgi:hypothetical protein
MRIPLLFLAIISMLILVACSKDDSYVIIVCGGTGAESEYFKEKPKPGKQEPEQHQNEIMKTSDPGIH